MTNPRIDATCSHSCRYAPQHGAASATHLFRRARDRAERGLLWSSLTGRSRTLFTLAQAGIVCQAQTRCDGTVHTVPISQIRGSEGRAGDFDCNFDPIQDHTRERWLGIAAARQRGKALPPVALVQVGSLYFVRDGHHRISVARAFGQKHIEATVEVWQVNGPLPRNAPAWPAGPQAGPPPAGTGLATRKGWHLSRRIRSWVAALHAAAPQTARHTAG